ncbi:PrgI family protein [Thermomonospora echinospora]|uniref:PrgI family protein n=1 Tax=Thermomonospora echinospora TaxID=1992 RepID=A0A1H5YT78_9ACTN|nr:PrgI family protein [Thermomonospora echinospora]SEG26705.1 PrgI family protein [Thermomonospora echinospora]
MTRDDEALTAKIPADIEQPDKIMYGLTARQVAILSATGLLASWGYMAMADRLPFTVIAAVLLPVIGGGAVLALARHDGMGLDRFALAALVHLHSSKARVEAPEGVHAPPAWCRVRGRLPAPLRLPVRAVREDGIMELADGGTAAVVRAGTVAFGLRTADEQAALVAAFGRWLNSLETPVQILVRARPVDLSAMVAQLIDTAPRLPHPALEQAARDHAAYLADLEASRELLTREVLIVLRDTAREQQSAAAFPWTKGKARRVLRDAGAVVVARRAEEAVRSLAVLGVTAEVLDTTACTAVLAESLSPADARLPEVAGPGELISAQEGPR